MSTTKEELGEIKKELDSLKKELVSGIVCISESERIVVRQQIAALEQRQNLLPQLLQFHQQSSSNTAAAASSSSPSTTTTSTSSTAEEKTSYPRMTNTNTLFSILKCFF